MKRWARTTRRRPQSARPHHRPNRRGFFAPVAALAMLVALAVAALVLDTLWLQAASVELEKCAEAAALAGAVELVSDDLLRAGGVTREQVRRAVRAAQRVARENPVAGQCVHLDPARGDIRVRLSDKAGEGGGRRSARRRSGRTWSADAAGRHSDAPLAVLVTAHRTRHRHNPVALLLRPPGGPAAGDVVAAVEVVLENRIRGLAATEGTTLPLLPLAILEGDAVSPRAETWAATVEGRHGTDHWSFDDDLGLPVARPDGLPELTLRFESSAGGDQPSTVSWPNAVWVDFGSRLRLEPLRRQLLWGVRAGDLTAWGGELVSWPTPLLVGAAAERNGRLADRLAAELQALVGQRRLCWLFTTDSSAGQPTTVRCTRLVAVRVMDVDRSAGGEVEVTVQPCVLLAPSALVATSSSDDVPPNPYVYKALVLHLARNARP